MAIAWAHWGMRLSPIWPVPLSAGTPKIPLPSSTSCSSLGQSSAGLDPEGCFSLVHLSPSICKMTYRHGRPRPPATLSACVWLKYCVQPYNKEVMMNTFILLQDLETWLQSDNMLEYLNIRSPTVGSPPPPIRGCCLHYLRR